MLGTTRRLVLLLVVSALFSGCGSPGGRATLTAVVGKTELPLNATTARYQGAGDSNTADFYLTDLPAGVWEQGGDVSGLSGSILHIHMFLAPKAGSTPIEQTACSAAVRWLVLSRGQIGVYGGGGFFRKSGDVGDDEMGGKIDRASLRLLRSTPGFEDRLGACTLSASFEAILNNDESQVIARAMSALAQQAGGAEK